MSLFGSSPDDSGLAARSEQKSSLFDNGETSGAKSEPGLFDNDGANGDSPWNMPTPKKGSKGDMVKSLLPGPDVPKSYIEAFDVISDSEYKTERGKISTEGVTKLLQSSKIGAVEQDRIVKLVIGDRLAASLGRNEFNVLLALIGLTQENEESTLDSVDERRKSM